jgi:hypothetical protein
MTSFTTHIETVVIYKIHTVEKKMHISVTMEKSYASILVMTKGIGVKPKNRGIQLNKIIRENTKFIINNSINKLKFESATVSKKNVELKYYIENIPIEISTFTMENDVIVGADDLAIVNAYVKIEKETRNILRFNKKNNSRTITYK